MRTHISTHKMIAAFTMLEVMAAVAVLAIATTAILGQWAGLEDARKRNNQKQMVHALLVGMSERLTGLDWASVGSSGAPWSQGRFFDRTGVTPIGLPPLTEDATNSRDNLRDQGLLTFPSNVRGLKIYIEYYRAITSGALPGMLADDTSEAVARLRFATRANRDASRITGANPTGTLGSEPVYIRLLATWMDFPPPNNDVDGDGVPDDAEDSHPVLGGPPNDALPAVQYVEIFTARGR